MERSNSVQVSSKDEAIGVSKVESDKRPQRENLPRNRFFSMEGQEGQPYQ